MKHLLISFFKFIVLFITPIFPLMLAVGAAIFADTYFGRRAARKLEGDDAVTSKITRKGLVPKLIGYQAAIITMFLLDGYALNEVMINYIPFAFVATKFVGAFLIWIEWSSINESYKKMKGYTINDKIVEFLKAIKKGVSKVLDFKKSINK